MAFEAKPGKKQPEPQVVWRCACGHSNFAHRPTCALCGSAKPNPKP